MRGLGRKGRKSEPSVVLCEGLCEGWNRMSRSVIPACRNAVRSFRKGGLSVRIKARHVSGVVLCEGLCEGLSEACERAVASKILSLQVKRGHLYSRWQAECDTGKRESHKNGKTSASRIPAWSPTAVLTGRYLA